MVMIFCSAARADEITTRDAHYKKIKIIDYAYGQIRFRQPVGDVADVSVLDVHALLVDSVGKVGDLNQAEIFIDKDEPAQAVVRYERALSTTEGFWKELTRVRLIQACDRAGYLDKATTNWLELLRWDEAMAAELLPRLVSPTRSRAVNRALADVEAALPRTKEEPARRLIELLRFSVYLRLGERMADELVEGVVQGELTGPIATVRAYEAKLEALRYAYGQGRTSLVLAGVDGALESCPATTLPDLLLFKGEVLLKTAKTRADYARAGLAFMRVPIHFPDDPRAGRALLWAARVHEKIEASGKAAELLRECLGRNDLDPKTKADAERLLEEAETKLKVQNQGASDNPPPPTASAGWHGQNMEPPLEEIV